MTQQTIEVPEGYKLKQPGTIKHYPDCDRLVFDVEKIQPRRIVLEITKEYNEMYHSGLYETQVFSNGIRLHNSTHLWREVKETDIPLTNAEPKLSLSVEECKLLTMYGMTNNEVTDKIREFIKDK